MLFNIVLEKLKMDLPELKEAVASGKLICFADDILLIAADGEEEAKALIK